MPTMNTPHHGKSALLVSAASQSAASVGSSLYGHSAADAFREQLVKSKRTEPARRFAALVAFRPPVEAPAEAVELFSSALPSRMPWHHHADLQYVFGNLTPSDEFRKWLTSGDPVRRFGGVAVDATAEALLHLLDSDVVASVEQEVVHQTYLERVRGIVGCDNTLDNALSGKGVTVAIIDTGIDRGHPAFDARIAPYPRSRNFVKGGNPSDYTDHHGHGTHVAGIVAGNGSPDGIFRGIAPRAELIVLKVSESGDLHSIAVSEAIDHAVEMGADVVNISNGYGPWNPPSIRVSPPWVWSAHDSYDDLLVNSVAARGKAAIPVAAGNHGRLTPADSSICRPGICQGVLTVGSVDLSATSPSLSNFSSLGPVRRTSAIAAGGVLGLSDLSDARIDVFPKPDVLAPGGHLDQHQSGFGCSDSQGVMSARASLSASGLSADEYIAAAGTSMSCPAVAGLAALMIELAREEGLGLDSWPQRGVIIHNIIRATSQRLAGLSSDEQGYGLVNWSNIQETLMSLTNQTDALGNFIRTPAEYE
ncbi:S8 family serine peptidase [Streptomyces sp. NPDC090057]|uniref:S8 family serine peptidase n=1 Tax=Streptomyces sp. NPDC090057 TaxID=3365935 RepID=UPI00381DD118